MGLTALTRKSFILRAKALWNGGTKTMTNAPNMTSGLKGKHLMIYDGT